MVYLLQTVPQNITERKNTMFDMIKIGKRIASLRKTCGMTQMSLANSLGISYQAVSNWERGLAMPDIANLKELAKVLETTVDDILDDDRSKILVAADEGRAPDETITPEEFNDVAPLLTAEQNTRLLDSVSSIFSDEQADEARANLDTDDFTDEQYAKMAFDSGNYVLFSLFVKDISEEMKEEMFERAFESGSPVAFSCFKKCITEEKAEQYVERAYNEDKLPLFAMLLKCVNHEKRAELALRALEEYNIPYVAMLKKYITDDERKKYKKKAFFSGNVALFSILKDKYIGTDDEDLDESDFDDWDD